MSASLVACSQLRGCLRATTAGLQGCDAGCTLAKHPSDTVDMLEGIKEAQMAERTAVRVLVVDDFGPWQHFVGGHLRGHPDIRIDSIASNVLEAMRKAQELQPDLVLLDVGLAELNGIPTARKILEVAPRSAVLFLSERSKVDVEHTALTAGVQGYILKSKETRDLRTVMQDLLHGPSFVSQAAAGCEVSD